MPEKGRKEPMSPLLFLAGIILAAVLIHAISSTLKTKRILGKLTATKMRLPSAIVQRIVLFAQISEFVQIVLHATVVNVIVIVILFAIWLAMRSGTEGEIY
jgi:hypothetical protein